MALTKIHESMKGGGIISLRQSHASGTHGGASSNSGWQKRALNTEVSNTISGASFNNSTGVLTLPAGRYRAVSSQTFNEVGKVSGRLRDTTNSTSLIVGARAHVPTGQTGTCPVEGSFTLNDTANVELQYNCNNNKGTDGAGQAQNNGDTEVFATLIVEKIG